jgi:hypothetical protein
MQVTGEAKSEAARRIKAATDEKNAWLAKYCEDIVDTSSVNARKHHNKRYPARAVAEDNGQGASKAPEQPSSSNDRPMGPQFLGADIDKVA